MMSRLISGLAAIALGLSALLAPTGASAQSPASSSEKSDDKDKSGSSERDEAAEREAQEAADRAAAEAAMIAEATSRLQDDLSRTRQVREAARDRYLVAKRRADKLAREVAQNKSAVDQARRIVGQYARSIYMGGPTDLTLLASVIDTDEPGDLIRRADSARRVGGSKDYEFREAMEVLRRTEETKLASDAAQSAAGASLGAVDDQLNGLRRQLAGVAGQWADHLAVTTSLLDPEQAERNSKAAASWAAYLTRLADLRVPVITASQIKTSDLPDGVTASRSVPGTAVWKSGSDRVVVLPERVIAAVTYAVSALGTPYRWQANTAGELDCSSLIDRAWNMPTVGPSAKDNKRALVAGGVPGLAERTALLPSDSGIIGDIAFLSDRRHGVNHAGIVLDDSTMIAADASSGGVNAIPIPSNRLWKVGRQVLPGPKRANALPKTTGKPWQCGADPSALMTTPDGKVIGSPVQCPAKPEVFGELNLVPEAIAVGRCVAAIWSQITTIGGWRPSDPYPDHPSGHAVDIMMPGGCSTDPANVAIGNAISMFFMKHAKRFGINYIIWHQKIWTSSQPITQPAQWRGMGGRGNCTANHMDHVHITVGNPPPGAATPLPSPSDEPKRKSKSPKKKPGKR
ncbi:MAG: NlpC/P60 family protein [Candidatus Nanopelagicales bacterium]|nr:NlpC/P60 family protein [Candidatus Nanopelagicales bacterium]